MGLTSDHKTTALGAIAGAGTLATVDWNKVVSLDYTEIGRMVVGLAMLLWGWFTNK